MLTIKYFLADWWDFLWRQVAVGAIALLLIILDIVDLLPLIVDLLPLNVQTVFEMTFVPSNIGFWLLLLGCLVVGHFVTYRNMKLRSEPRLFVRVDSSDVHFGSIDWGSSDIKSKLPDKAYLWARLEATSVDTIGKVNIKFKPLAGRMKFPKRLVKLDEDSLGWDRSLDGLGDTETRYVELRGDMEVVDRDPMSVTSQLSSGDSWRVEVEYWAVQYEWESRHRKACIRGDFESYSKCIEKHWAT